MTSTRSESANGTTPECALVQGAPECACVQEAELFTEEQIVTRALSKLRFEQRADAAGKAAARRGLDGLLAHARTRGPSSLVSELLRMGLMIRLLTADDAEADDVEALLQEFIELADLDGDPRRLGEAASLRAHRTAVFGHGENALADAAAAFAILTDIKAPTPGHDPVRWSRELSRSLNGLVVVLLKLGSHELADEVSQRAVAVSERSGSVMDRLVHQLNRVRLQLSWALRLERGGRDAAAATRFVGAAQTAHVAARLWQPAMSRGSVVAGPAVRECSVIGAAYALQRPGGEHLEMLQTLHPMAHFTEDRVVLAIGTARCLLTAGRPDEAAAALAPLHEELRDADTSDAVLALALHREVARIEHIARGGTPSEALQHYATALESELWALREARHTALRSHSEHHRLAREHGTVAAQALQDPLTGLPNRRALDMRLDEATSTASSQPCAVALIDLDGFKDVNDARSHAVGDEVLQEVASCLRTTLRAQDLVARYGGDEFVVVMPATPLPVACAALQRAADAVAALPVDAAAGVTISVGVVRAPLDGEPSAALAAADSAMYRAKRAGGNTVVSGAAAPGGGRDGAGPPARGPARPRLRVPPHR
ncbi:GGDEF domain-containing protein [Pseudonocardia sp. MH-G8]|uniref:GGDEF domain-containing protein n=1 Tax=Pseudonocardia sp. MH-G8 TaxID=1854588 RepID=UPI00117A4361|nr:GGDEF domain-containing protein [Pseudonocardia sp. MH-G8]